MDYVRPGGALHEPRLRAALSQLAEQALLGEQAGQGLCLRPDAIRVDRTGRIGIDRAAAVLAAPAQGAPAPSGSQALGRVLYEALVGQPPDNEVRASVRSVAPTAPGDLADLTQALLSEGAAGAVSLEHVRDRLQGRPPPMNSESRSTFTKISLFVGREFELAELQRAIAAGRAVRGLSPVLLIGASGVGKSSLAERLADRLREQLGDVLVLRGACHPRDVSCYPGFDELMERATRFMMRLPPAERARVLGGQGRALSCLFPCMLALPELSAPSEDARPSRQRARQALLGVLGRLALDRPTVLILEDLQWANSESLTLLSALAEWKDGNGPLCLVGTTRELARCDGAVGQVFGTGRGHVQSVEPLDPEDAEHLASALLASGPSGLSELASRVACQSRGVPLAIEALAHRCVASPPTSDAVLDLDDALRSMVEVLPDAARRAWDLLTVAGRPVPRAVLSAALQLPPEQWREGLQALRLARLVTVDRTGDSRALTRAHHGVADAVAQAMDGDHERACHAQLAVAYRAQRELRPAECGDHLCRAGRAPQAVQELCLAADRAATAMAFDVASGHYATALGAAPADRALQVRAQWADCLRRAGRLFDAAEEYLALAAAAGAAGAGNLRAEAARCYHRAGQPGRALELAADTLAEHGLQDLIKPGWLRVRTAAERGRLRLQGRRFTPREHSTLSPAKIALLDALWTALRYHVCSDPRIAAMLHARAVRETLLVGEPGRVGHALWSEAMWEALSDPESDHHVRRASHHWQSPHGVGCVLQRDTVAAARALGEGRLDSFVGQALDAAPAHEVLPAEDGARRLLRLVAHQSRFDMPRLVAELDQLTDHADPVASTLGRLRFGHWELLLQDQVTRALSQLSDQLDRWSDQPFGLPHLCALLARCEVGLYCGGTAGLSALDAEWGRVLQSSWLRLPWIRREVWSLRCTALRVAAGEGRGSPLLTEAKRVAQRLQREQDPVLRTYGGWASAACVAQRGPDRRSALPALQRAYEQLRSTGYEPWVRACRYQIGRATAGHRGADLRCQELDWAAAQGAERPQRLLHAIGG